MQKAKGTKKAPRLGITVGTAEDLDYFIENVSMLLGSGMSLVDCLEAVRAGLRSKAVRRVVGWIESEVAAGMPFSHALHHTRLFPSHVISLVQIGEESGRLSENLKLVSEQQKKDRVFRTKMRSALVYPVFVLSLTLVVGIGIAWFILPKLSLVFSQLRVELPALTRALIKTGEFLSQYGLIAVPSFIALMAVLLYFIFYFPKTKNVGQSIFFRLPGLGELMQQVEIARFSYLLGSLLAAGVPIVSAIESLEEAASFHGYKKFYKYLKVSISQGNSFKKSFDSYTHLRRIVPVPIQQLVVSGEKSGKLSQSLSNIAKTYEEKIDITTKNLTVMLEPILLVIVWLGVVAVALAVILPIYSLVGNFNPNPTENISEEVETTGEVSAEIPPTEIYAPPIEVVLEESNTKLQISSEGLTYLNVRSEPREDGEIIGTAIPGGEYVYGEEIDGWYGITLPEDIQGWVSGEYVTVIENQEE